MMTDQFQLARHQEQQVSGQLVHVPGLYPHTQFEQTPADGCGEVALWSTSPQPSAGFGF